MQKALAAELGLLTPPEELEYMFELIQRYPHYAIEYLRKHGHDDIAGKLARLI